tara:strand:- start:454 stop:912 length:459 start_codon:yes stop_codon:yes gene_type:complete
MQISCPSCRKNFFVKDDLIPNEGRQLQCGKCFNEWFFKKSHEVKNTEVKKIVKTDNEIKMNDDVNEKIYEEKNTKNTNLTKKNENKEQEIKKNNINIFKLILVIIISFVAVIIIIETFKNQISVYFPSILIILDNLFQTLKDIYLFIKDLIK